MEIRASVFSVKDWEMMEILVTEPGNLGRNLSTCEA